MTVETTTFINNLDINNPDSFVDPISEGAEHIRLMKSSLQNTFPNVIEPITISSDQLNLTFSNISHSGTSFIVSNKSIKASSATQSNSVANTTQMDAEFIRPDTSYVGDLIFDNTKGINSNGKSLIKLVDGWVVIGDPTVDTYVYGSITSPNVEITQGGSSNITRPIGSIYENGLSSANPATLLGFGTWQEFGSQSVIVGYKVDASKSECRTISNQFGNNVHTLSLDELPAHNHKFTIYRWELYNTPQTGMTGQYTASSAYPATVNPTGGGESHNNMMPYRTIKRWIRTA